MTEPEAEPVVPFNHDSQLGFLHTQLQFAFPTSSNCNCPDIEIFWLNNYLQIALALHTSKMSFLHPSCSFLDVWVFLKDAQNPRWKKSLSKKEDLLR